jgi:hypothetical protein
MPATAPQTAIAVVEPCARAASEPARGRHQSNPRLSPGASVLRCDIAYGSSALSCHACWPCPPMCYRLAW